MRPVYHKLALESACESEIPLSHQGKPLWVPWRPEHLELPPPQHVAGLDNYEIN